MPFPTDLQVARGASPKQIEDIAARMGIGARLIEPYRREVLMIRLEAVEEPADRPKAQRMVVSAATPTPLGEAKTTTTVGLRQAMKHGGREVTVGIRQPSAGPTFGIKGGAAGGSCALETVARRVYGAGGVDYDTKAARRLDRLDRYGFGDVAVRIATTHLSISSDSSWKGAPTGWRPTTVAHTIDIDENAGIRGLS